MVQFSKTGFDSGELSFVAFNGFDLREGGAESFLNALKVAGSAAL